MQQQQQQGKVQRRRRRRQQQLKPQQLQPQQPQHKALSRFQIAETPIFRLNCSPLTSIGIKKIVVLRDGTFITCSNDLLIKRWSQTGKLLNQYKSQSISLLCAIEWDQNVIISAGGGGFRVWNLELGRCVSLHDTRCVYSMLKLKSKPSTLLASCDTDLLEWRITGDTFDFELVGTFPHLVVITHLCELSDGTVIATQYSSMLKWDLDRKDVVLKFSGHVAKISDVIVLQNSEEGETIASASLDGTIKIWNTATGECLRMLNAINTRLRANSFYALVQMPDDGALVSIYSTMTPALSVWNQGKGDNVASSTSPLSFTSMELGLLPNGSIVIGGFKGELEIRETWVM